MAKEATGKVQISLYAKVDKSVDKAFGKMKTGAQAVGKVMKSAFNVGAVVAAGAAASGIAIGALINKYMAFGDSMDKMAKRARVSVEFLDQVGYAFEKNGGSTEEAGSALREFNKTVADAGTGNAQLLGLFATLGLSIRDINGNLKPTEKLFLETATALENTEDGALRARAANLLFKGASDQLLVTLPSLRKEMERKVVLGVATSEQAEKAAMLSDSLLDLKIKVFDLGWAFAEKLMPHLTKVTDMLTKMFLANEGDIEKGLGAAAEFLGQNMEKAAEAAKEFFREMIKFVQDGRFEKWLLDLKMVMVDIKEQIGSVNKVKNTASGGFDWLSAAGKLTPAAPIALGYEYLTSGTITDPFSNLATGYQSFNKAAAETIRNAPAYNIERDAIQKEYEALDARIRENSKKNANAIADSIEKSNNTMAEVVKKRVDSAQLFQNAENSFSFM